MAARCGCGEHMTLAGPAGLAVGQPTKLHLEPALTTKLRPPGRYACRRPGAPPPTVTPLTGRGRSTIVAPVRIGRPIPRRIARYPRGSEGGAYGLPNIDREACVGGGGSARADRRGARCRGAAGREDRGGRAAHGPARQEGTGGGQRRQARRRGVE